MAESFSQPSVTYFPNPVVGAYTLTYLRDSDWLVLNYLYAPTALSTFTAIKDALDLFPAPTAKALKKMVKLGWAERSSVTKAYTVTAEGNLAWGYITNLHTVLNN